MASNIIKQLSLLTAVLLLAGCSGLGIYIVKDSLNAGQHNDLGVSYEREGKLKLAEKEYKRAIKKDSNWHVPYFNLGNVYCKLSKHDAAVKAYKSALKINPENSDIMNNLAFALMKSGKPEVAEKWILKAISIEAKPQYLDTRKEINEKLMGR